MADNMFDVNTDTLLRFGAGGLAGGASIGLILNLMREFKEKKDSFEKSEGDKDNILTITLPSKKPEPVAEITKEVEPELIEDLTDEELEYFEGLSKNSAVSVNKETDRVTVKNLKAPEGNFVSAATTKTKVSKGGTTMSAKMRAQSRHYDGQFGKSANWETLAASILAVTGAGYAGLKGVDMLFDAKNRGELEDELDEARAAYQAKLQDALSKTATDNTFRWGDYPLALSALALLVGGGSTAYLTKKVLDSMNKTPKSDYDRPKTPEIQRIVFKTDKEASARDTADTAIAMLGVYTDAFTKSADVVSDHEVASKLAAHGWTPKSIYKAAANNEEFERLSTLLAQAPDIRNAMKRATMDKHPILKYLKWGADLPFIRNITDASLYDRLSAEMGPLRDMADRKFKMRDQLGMAKMSSLLGAAPLITSAIGSTIANELDESMEERIKEEEKSKRGKVTTVDGLDPEAEAYILDHRDEIEAILRMIDKETPKEKRAWSDSRLAGQGVLRSILDTVTPGFLKNKRLLNGMKTELLLTKQQRNITGGLGILGTGAAGVAYVKKDEEYENLLNEIAMAQALAKHAGDNIEKSASFSLHRAAYRNNGGGLIASFWDAAKKAHLWSPGIHDGGLIQATIAKSQRDRTARNAALGFGVVGLGAGGLGLNKYLTEDEDKEQMQQYLMQQEAELEYERSKMSPIMAGSLGAMLGVGAGVGGKVLYDKYAR